ncbi:MAG TPA: thiamine pyrophosphate-dependent enzyme, partial [candidate division Zixibacteria bacterium]|nr:thiamine pyrophosphate-dependent enzyme [candidate division Zixibacteria bacterium]
TYRWYGHSEIDPADYRSPEEVAYWKTRDPLTAYEKYLMENKKLTTEEKQKFVEQIDKELDEAVDFAEAADYGPVEWILGDIYADFKANATDRP